MQSGDHDDVQPYGQVLAANVRAARARADLTQEALAERMRQLGCKWHFQTVGSVERGQRPLQAYEVAALAMALDTVPDDLLTPPFETAAVAFGDQVIPSERLVHADKSVSWDGGKIRVTAPSWHRDRYQAWAEQAVRGTPQRTPEEGRKRSR